MPFILLIVDVYELICSSMRQSTHHSIEITLSVQITEILMLRDADSRAAREARLRDLPKL